MADSFPFLRAIVLDAVDARQLAEFWRRLLGYTYAAGDEPPPDGEADPNALDWLVLHNREGVACLAVQAVAELPRATWPTTVVPQQLHLDLTVADVAQLAEQHQRVLALGGTVLEDRTNDPNEALVVFADPAGHPFCILVSPSEPR